MPLAAPLILPFAELAGITIAGLGMAAASKKVSDFISDNPEISTQILTTLVPGGVGLNALFKDKDAPSTKDIVLGELGKEKGNYSSPDAEGAYSSKRGRIIKALEEAGKIKKGPDKDYDSSKKHKGYKKFYEKADGGAIGIEVLFEEKKNGGRIGYVGGGLATTQDFANALKSVSAGTTYQQQIQAKEYARNEASNLLSQAMRSADPNKGPGLQGIYDTFFRTTLSPGIRPKTFTPDSSGRMIMYSARDRDAILDSMANQMLNTTPYAAPRPKTYRTVSPEAQALNMSQSTYEDIIRSGADPKQYYIDYQNRMMTEGGNYGTPGTSSYTGPQLLKYGQVIGGPGMVIAGPGTAPGATPPTQAQMNQMMQNNPAGYMDFADLVKTYSADPYKGLQEEIKDMVDGRDTGYMGGQDYYDINVLGLDGRGIAEKYGLQYADGGRIGFANGGENIIGADLKDPDTEMNQNTEMNQMIPPGGINFSNIKNYASIPATYGAALYGNYINQRVGENMARAFRTDEMNERLSQQVGDKLSPGINSGSLTYTDFGLDPVREYIGGGEFRNTRDFNPPSFEKAMSLNSADLANALTLGNLNFNKDPSGNINYTGNTFDFPQPTFMNNNPVDIPLDELNVNAPQFSFTDYLQGNYDLNKSPTTDIVVPERTAPATYYNSAPNFNANVLLEEEDAQYNLPQKNIFQRAGNFIGKLNLEDYLPFIGQKSLTGTMGRGIGNLFQNIAPARYGTSQRAYNALTPQGRSTVGSIYGPGGIMSGYNAVSAFGRGPIGAIDNRIGNIYNRKAPQTDASKKTIQDLYKAREKIMQTTLDSDRQYTGPKSSPRGQKAGVMDDDPFGGTSGTTGGSSKIVCTMMNESYGFGNFRNKIWLKHSKDLPKEYEIGYHTIFLPLVNFAKKEGKVNKLVKKILEHIAKHRTLDLKQEMRGKTHTLGRVYRKILEPICLMVGKIKKEVK
jgi:hypothetical protein